MQKLLFSDVQQTYLPPRFPSVLFNTDLVEHIIFAVENLSTERQLPPHVHPISKTPLSYLFPLSVSHRPRPHLRFLPEYAVAAAAVCVGTSRFIVNRNTKRAYQFTLMPGVTGAQPLHFHLDQESRCDNLAEHCHRFEQNILTALDLIVNSPNHASSLYHLINSPIGRGLADLDGSFEITPFQ